MIFFDFDGTLVDVWERYYHVFVTAGGFTSVGYDTYVQLKKNFIKDDLVAEQLHFTLASTYYAEKKKLLERPDFLKLDTPLIDVDTLLDFFIRFPCRILTIRRSPNAFFEQLKNLGLSAISEKSIVLQPELGVSKYEYLAVNYGAEENIIIGDAVSEYETSQLKNMKVILVRTGLRRPEDFTVRRNVYTVEHVAQFISQYKMKTGLFI